MEKSHKEALGKIVKLQIQMGGPQHTGEEEELYGEREAAFDGFGAVVDPLSLQCQVHTELAQLASTVPEDEAKGGESPEQNPFFRKLVEKATASLVAKNMSTEVAKALSAQKTFFDSLWDNRMNELQQDGRYKEMHLYEPPLAEKRKPAEQLEPEDVEKKTEMAPKTPDVPRPVTQPSTGAAGSASGTARVNPY